MELNLDRCRGRHGEEQEKHGNRTKSFHQQQKKNTHTHTYTPTETLTRKSNRNMYFVICFFFGYSEMQTHSQLLLKYILYIHTHYIQTLYEIIYTLLYYQTSTILLECIVFPLLFLFPLHFKQFLSRSLSERQRMTECEPILSGIQATAYSIDDK